MLAVFCLPPDRPRAMTVMIVSFGFVVAALCAGLMGYAIHSGATCTVYAVTELVEQRRPGRLIAMLEAGLWVAFVFAVAGALPLGLHVPALRRCG